VLAIEVVEALRHVARHLDVLHLVAAHRDRCALNIRMSAAISTGYMNRPMVTSASASTPAAAFLSTCAL
jgi:hypothetical protein